MMLDDKLIELLEMYSKGGGGDWFSSVEPTKLGDRSYADHWEFDKLSDYEHARRHAAWMATQAIEFVKEAQASENSMIEMRKAAPGFGPSAITEWAAAKVARSKREKAHRWLGFIQATLFLCGVYTLDELKEHSRKCSDEPEKAESRG